MYIYYICIYTYIYIYILTRRAETPRNAVGKYNGTRAWFFPVNVLRRRRRLWTRLVSLAGDSLSLCASESKRLHWDEVGGWGVQARLWKVKGTGKYMEFLPVKIDGYKNLIGWKKWNLPLKLWEEFIWHCIKVLDIFFHFFFIYEHF